MVEHSAVNRRVVGSSPTLRAKLPVNLGGFFNFEILIKPLTISELTSGLKELIETSFSYVFLIGEITNFKQHSPSGHFYFTLKDDNAQISAVMWKSKNISLGYNPENGDLVVVKGRITLFASSGRYQVEVFEMEKQGLGNLQIEFENLKNKLKAEGLFDVKYKVPLEKFPKYPKNIAVITSETGAAIQDIAKVTRKRFPLVKLHLSPVNVQGKSSVSEIVNAINYLDANMPEVEIIILARGGGSLEDLWTFNSEEIVRTIFRSKKIIVSAIGHETDFSLCDFAADLRAPTPSAAMEMILPDIVEIQNELDYFSDELIIRIDSITSEYKLNIEYFYNNFHFNKPLGLINEFSMRLDEFNRNINYNVSSKLNSLKFGLNNMNDLMNSFCPDRILKRGYSIIFKKDKVISSVKKVFTNDFINIQFSDGKLNAEIKENNNAEEGR
jgi:exodeoxyribonuclease VII large subunit